MKRTNIKLQEPVFLGGSNVPVARFEVEKNIYLPPRGGRPTGFSKYPLDIMEPGDSFFVPSAKPTSFSGVLTNFRRSNPDKASWKFTTRQREEGGVRGIRLWRVS